MRRLATPASPQLCKECLNVFFLYTEAEQTPHFPLGKEAEKNKPAFYTGNPKSCVN